MKRNKYTLAERLMRGSRVDGSCLVWAKSSSHGYGRIGIGKDRLVAVHRAAYELAYGPVPKGKEVDHICRNRMCFRPDHLRAVTNKQNQENRSDVSTDGRSGVRGVSWSKQKKAWIATVIHNRQSYYFGSYSSIEEAAKAVAVGRNSLYTHNEADRHLR